MRNLKRALSLTLASVMLLGMMVVGTSAAAGYDDVDKEDNVEAIEVLQEIGVMVGDERGFGPDRPVNRAEMAVVMSLLLNLDYNYYASSCPFGDVYDWARGPVGACYANKIVSGRGEGVYDPGATVTAVEAASMLMRALGYFQYSNDYADGFELSTVREGTKIGIFDGVGSNASASLTRNQVAQMVLNALKSGVVEPDGNTINLTTPDGSVLTGRVNYVYVTSNKDFAYAIGKVGATSIGSQNTGAIVELGERLYNGDLKLNDYQVDDFGRPARQWEYKGNEIGTYMKKELLKKEWTVEVTGKDLYDLLTKNTVEDYDFEITIDGETEQSVLTDAYYFTQGNLVRTNTKGVGGTGKGVLTQVFVDPNEGDGKVYIAIINTYLAIADDDYNEKREEATFTIHHINSVSSNKALLKATNKTDTAPRDVKNEDIKVEDVKKDDIVLVHVAENEIKEIITPEILSDKTISAFKLEDWVRTDGTQYDEANTAQYDNTVLNKYSNHNMKEVTFNIILDEYGYMIGIEQNEDPDQYVFITGNDGGSSDLRDKEAEVAGIFLDGTMKVIKVDTKKSDPISGGAIVNKWFTYTKNDNDVYTLKAISASFTGDQGQWAQNVNDGGSYVNANSADSYTIDKAHVALMASSDGVKSDRRVYGNDDTVYLNVSTSVIGTKSNYVASPGDPGVATTITGNGFSKIATNDPDLTNYYATTTGPRAVIIDDVDSVTTGVKNANILVSDVKASKYDNGAGSKYADGAVAVPKSEIYTLYDTDGYVIAAVVIGEDQGTTSQYAYVHTSNVKFEEYGHKTGSSSKAVEGKWSWEREVIINGEIVTLTEVEDSDWAYIEPENMLQGEWYKVSFNADGQVRKAEKATEFPANRWATDVDLVETYHDLNQDLVILEVNYTGTNNIHAVANGGSAKAVPITNRGPLSGGLRFENGTLYTDYVNRKGFSVAADVKVVYANAELRQGYDTTDCGNFARVKWFDETYDSYTGYAGVEKVLKLIDSRDSGNFYGVLNAVLENGVATSIIINDTYGEYVDRGGPITPSTKNGYPNVINNGGTLEVRYYGTAPTAAEIEKLISDGVNGETVSYSDLTKTATIGTGLTATRMNVVLKEVVAIKAGTTDVGYVDKGVATTKTFGGFAASKDYIAANTAKTATASSANATPDYSSNAKGEITFTGVTLNSDLSLVPAYQVKVGTNVVAKVGATTLTVDATYYNLVAENAVIAVNEDDTSKAADDNTTHTLKAGDTVIASKLVNSAGSAADKAAVSGSWTVTGNTTLTVARGTKSVKINNQTYSLTGSENNAALMALLDLRDSEKGVYMVDVATKQPVGTNLATVTGSDLVSGHEYETGYYKATIAGSGTTGNNGVHYVKGGFTLMSLIGSTNYTKAADGTYAKVDSSSVYKSMTETLNITADTTYNMAYYKVTYVNNMADSSATDKGNIEVTNGVGYAKASESVTMSVVAKAAATTGATLTYTVSGGKTATETQVIAANSTGADAAAATKNIAMTGANDDVTITITVANT